MLSKNTISIFCDLLKNLAEKEKLVEINRQVLCQNLNFDAYQVFSYLDLESKNYLNEINLITFLQKKNQIPCTIEEMQFLILLYDENFDAKLSYSEFLNFVLCDNDLCEDFNVHDLFHYLKGYGDITSESLKIFLEKNYIQFDENDIRNIIKILDLNKDSKIDFSEFHYFLCFPKLKCNCCCFCQCNCIISNKMLYNNFEEVNNSENLKGNESLKMNINNIIEKHHFQINNLEKENNFQKKYFKYPNIYPYNHIDVDSTTAENQFLCYIAKLIECEKKIETAKINLIKRQDFNIEDAFLIFSNSENNIILFPDFEKGLKELGLYPSMKEIKLIMKRVDNKNKGHLIFEDFFDLLIPYSQEYRKNFNLENRIPSYYYPFYKKENAFLLQTKIYFMNLIRTIIESEMELNDIKENMDDTKSHLEDIIRKIDKNLLGFFNEEELYIYLRNSGINCNDFENKLIFNRLDKNKDGKIEIREIKEELSYT